MKYIFTILLSVFFLPTLAQAAEFYFEHPKQVVLGESVVTLRLKTDGEKVNAVAGNILLPKGVTVSNILSGDSSIVLWLENPKAAEDGIAFSGVTPGGFQGDVKIFSFVIGASSLPNTSVKVAQAEVRRNDAEATLIPSTSREAFFSFIEGKGKAPEILNDIVPPEAFTLVISSDPNVFEGQKFVVFSTQDKGTGIARYEWARGFLGLPKASSWQEGQSPLLIPRDHYFSRIYIKAVDNAGNETVESIGAPYRYAVTSFMAIIILLALCVLFFFVRSSSRRSS